MAPACAEDRLRRCDEEGSSLAGADGALSGAVHECRLCSRHVADAASADESDRQDDALLLSERKSFVRDCPDHRFGGAFSSDLVDGGLFVALDVAGDESGTLHLALALIPKMLALGSDCFGCCIPDYSVEFGGDRFAVQVRGSGNSPRLTSPAVISKEACIDFSLRE